MLALLVVWLFVPKASAHVVLVYPTPRTDNDYLYTFEAGVCNGESCNTFCGDPNSQEENPVTVLPVGVPIALRWNTNVAHVPYQYRLSFNPQAQDNNFDRPENILAIVDNAEVADVTNTGLTGSFSTNVTIPASFLESCANNSTPCVLQLYDLYYFVSCANVLLTENVTDTPDIAPPASHESPPMPQSDLEILVQDASFQDYLVTVGPNTEGGSLDPVLFLKRCKRYTFQIWTPGHPFVLKTTPGIGLSDLLILSANDESLYEASGSFPTAENQGIEKGNFTFLARETAPSTGLFYQCTLHEEMYSRIEWMDPDEDDVDEFGSCIVLATSTNATSHATNTRFQPFCLLLMVVSLFVLR